MAELAVRSWQPASGFRARTRKTTRTAALRRASLILLSTAFAIAGLMVAFSSAAGAAVATPLVSTATSASGTSLHVTYNETPVLASSYSLTLTDGSHVDTLSSAAGTLSASVSGTTINFTVQGSTSVSLSSLVEILGSTGVSDASGNAWDLVASGQVDKFYLLRAGDSVAVTYNEPVTVGGSYSFTLSEGSASTTIDNGDSNVAGGNGTSTITYDLTNDPSGNVAADGPIASGTSGVTATPTVQVGDTLKAVFTGSVTIGASYSLTLSDGSDAGTLTSGTNLSGGTAIAEHACGRRDHGQLHGHGCPGDDDRRAAVRLRAHRHGSDRSHRRSGALLPHHQRTAAAFAEHRASTSIAPNPTVSIDNSTTCSNISGLTRVFNGSNCDIGSVGAGRARRLRRDPAADPGSAGTAGRQTRPRSSRAARQDPATSPTT